MLPHVFSGFPYVERFYSYSQLTSTNEKAAHSTEIPQKGVFIFQTDSRVELKAHSDKNPVAESDGCLWVSILQQITGSSSHFTHTRALSLAIISSIKHFFQDAPLFLKWPDTILWNRKEICSVHAETHHTSLSSLVTGFGLNVNIPIDNIPQHLQSVSTSVLIETGKKIPLSTLLRKIVESYKIFIEKSPEEYHSYYCSLLSHQNERVIINKIEGIFKTVTIDGQATIETESGPVATEIGTIGRVEEV